MILNVPVTVHVILLAERTTVHPDRDHDVQYIGVKESRAAAIRHVEQNHTHGDTEWLWRWVNGRYCGFNRHHAQAIWLIEEEL